ncbi:uncharacterized protein LOC126067461 isoform X4 [Elephas maximus indicus]|uniref:uncharacterized protein LOC126067461 isoform X4 n=1 Tax=Elephas maximus indicus TaxID=99487 RepID=UPI00211688FA|nr:uncharacterized protein LOC126067461 isoform X4 [Elephas maximus indicus]
MAPGVHWGLAMVHWALSAWLQLSTGDWPWFTVPYQHGSSCPLGTGHGALCLSAWLQLSTGDWPWFTVPCQRGSRCPLGTGHGSLCLVSVALGVHWGLAMVHCALSAWHQVSIGDWPWFTVPCQRGTRCPLGTGHGSLCLVSEAPGVHWGLAMVHCALSAWLQVSTGDWLWFTVPCQHGTRCPLGTGHGSLCLVSVAPGVHWGLAMVHCALSAWLQVSTGDWLWFTVPCQRGSSCPLGTGHGSLGLVSVIPVVHWGLAMVHCALSAWLQVSTGDWPWFTGPCQRGSRCPLGTGHGSLCLVSVAPGVHWGLAMVHCALSAWLQVSTGDWPWFTVPCQRGSICPLGTGHGSLCLVSMAPGVHWGLAMVYWALSAWLQMSTGDWPWFTGPCQHGSRCPLGTGHGLLGLVSVAPDVYWGLAMVHFALSVWLQVSTGDWPWFTLPWQRGSSLSTGDWPWFTGPCQHGSRCPLGTGHGSLGLVSMALGVHWGLAFAVTDSGSVKLAAVFHSCLFKNYGFYHQTCVFVVCFKS